MSKDKLRRYPALGFLVVAALMASLLPSALMLPLSGPPGAAELAPVPGKSDAPGDLNSLGATSTGGLGAGSGTLGEGPGGRPPDLPEILPPGKGSNPRNKMCVAGRQTEDPTSPTCVAFFKGDNGGATAPGVTKDEIRIVIMTCGGNGLELVDVNDKSTWGGGDYEALAAYVRYFNNRYQLYDRKVRVFETAATKASCNTRAENIAQIQNVHETLTPFFALAPDGSTMQEEAARLGIMMEILPRPRRDYLPHAPYLVSKEQDFDGEAMNTVGAVCARLAGRPARFAGDPTMHDDTRKFGILFTRGSDPTDHGARMMHEGINRTCPREAGEVVVGYGSDADEETVITRLRIAGVTTVIALTSLPYFTEADAQKWYPEWLRLGDHVGNNALTISGMPGASLRTGVMGLMQLRRWGVPQGEPHRTALAEGGCEGPCTPNINRYDEFNLVFTGIQAAGPRLTAANWDRGIRSLPVRQSQDPFAPSAYFSPGNYSFVKDYAFVWFDVSGRPPGGARLGCWRLPEGGLRYRTEDWQKRPGDADVHASGQPCQGDA